MDWFVELVVILGLLLGVILGGMWLPFGILGSAVVGILMADGLGGLRALGYVLWGASDSFTLTAIPLFILMSEILLGCNVMGPLYTALARLVRPLPGGLLQTNIAASALFSAICGSSVATAAAIGTVAIPNLSARGYDRPMAFGSLAAGGTLGILIPPSIPLILYGSFTQLSVAKLFMAGIIPGLTLSFIFMIYLGIRTSLTAGPQREMNDGEPLSIMRAIADLTPFAVLMLAILGGIYLGVATPTEAAALGCVLAGGIGALMGRLTLEVVRTAVKTTLRSSGAILFIVVSAQVFAYAFENAGLGTDLTKWILSFGLERHGLLLVLFLLFLILGCILESIAMIVITVPLLYPAILATGINPIWFGIALVVLIELGQLTPPFGINLFVLKRISDAPLSEIVWGVVPYYGLIILFLGIMTVWPQIALWLPNAMFAQ